MTDKFLKGVGTAVVGVLIYAIIALAIGWLVMLLWNAVIPAVFGLKAITYWQGFLLSWLCSVLFKGTASVETKKS